MDPRTELRLQKLLTHHHERQLTTAPPERWLELLRHWDPANRAKTLGLLTRQWIELLRRCRTDGPENVAAFKVAADRVVVLGVAGTPSEAPLFHIALRSIGLARNDTGLICYSNARLALLGVVPRAELDAYRAGPFRGRGIPADAEPPARRERGRPRNHDSYVTEYCVRSHWLQQWEAHAIGLAERELPIEAIVADVESTFGISRAWAMKWRPPITNARLPQFERPI
jgi:hypothetical protein